MAPAVEVRGLKDFRRDLRDLGWSKELRLVHKKLADDIAEKARSAASSMGGVQAKAAAAIKGRATQSSAKVGISPGARYPMANAAFWGAKRRSGWYARARYQKSQAQQLPTWVGNTWDVGGSGGPYAINPTIKQYLPDIIDHYDEMLDDLTKRAFPDR